MTDQHIRSVALPTPVRRPASTAGWQWPVWQRSTAPAPIADSASGGSEPCIPASPAAGTQCSTCALALGAGDTVRTGARTAASPACGARGWPSTRPCAGRYAPRLGRHPPNHPSLVRPAARAFRQRAFVAAAIRRLPALLMRGFGFASLLTAPAPFCTDTARMPSRRCNSVIRVSISCRCAWYPIKAC